MTAKEIYQLLNIEFNNRIKSVTIQEHYRYIDKTSEEMNYQLLVFYDNSNCSTFGNTVENCLVKIKEELC